MVQKGSPLWQLVVLWGGHVLVTFFAALFIFLQLKKRTKKINITYLLVLGMIMSAWILILIPELVYVKDIYPNHPRANTMFKLTFQAFILMGLSVGWFSGFLHKKIFSKDLRIVFRVIIVLFIIGVGFYPYYSYRSYYGNFKKYRGLNGLTWLEDRHPGDYLGILWLQENTSDGEHVLEAVGDSYTTFARVSTFSGLPTVLGWRVHEWLWRGGFDIPSQRTEEVRSVYERPLSAEAQRVLKEYDVRYVFVGDMEKEAYPGMDVVEVAKLGEVVFRSGGSFVLRI